MSRHAQLDAASLLKRVAERVPPSLRANVVVVGGIAAAWAFRDVSGTHSVATKDIDLLLRPAINAVSAAETLGRRLIDAGWRPQFPSGIALGTADAPDDRLPVLRLTPPERTITGTSSCSPSRPAIRSSASTGAASGDGWPNGGRRWPRSIRTTPPT